MDFQSRTPGVLYSAHNEGADMTNETKRPEPHGSIDEFQIMPQPFGRLPVVASALVTGGLPPEAFQAKPAPKEPTTPPPSRQSRD